MYKMVKSYHKDFIVSMKSETNAGKSQLNTLGKSSYVMGVHTVDENSFTSTVATLYVTKYITCCYGNFRDKI